MILSNFFPLFPLTKNQSILISSSLYHTWEYSNFFFFSFGIYWWWNSQVYNWFLFLLLVLFNCSTLLHSPRYIYGWHYSPQENICRFSELTLGDWRKRTLLSLLQVCLDFYPETVSSSSVGFFWFFLISFVVGLIKTWSLFSWVWRFQFLNEGFFECLISLFCTELNLELKGGIVMYRFHV